MVVTDLLKDFVDMMPLELPPRRSMDRQIELLPRTQPRAQVLYRMPTFELVELRKQLDELL